MENNIVLQVGVKILLKNKEGKYLLVRRSVEKYPDIIGAGRWDIVGGRIDPGATLMENLKREIKEETALGLVGEPKLIAAQDIMRTAGRHTVRLTYIGEATGEVFLDKTENDMYKWYTLNELSKSDGIDFFLKELLDNGKLSK